MSERDPTMCPHWMGFGNYQPGDQCQPIPTGDRGAGKIGYVCVRANVLAPGECHAPIREAVVTPTRPVVDPNMFVERQNPRIRDVVNMLSADPFQTIKTAEDYL